MSDERTVFVTFPADQPWTQQETDHLAEAIAGAFPEDVNAVAMPDDIEFLDADQVAQYVEDLRGALEDDDSR